jgi:nucleoside-diphosphate-sugar epimerase
MNLSSCEQVRDHCAVADVARGILSAVKRRSEASGGSRFFNLGSASTATLRTLIEHVVSELGLNVTLNFGARPMSPTEPKYLVADIQRAGHELDWKPAIRFPHAVWQLARASFPELRVNEPRRSV